MMRGILRGETSFLHFEIRSSGSAGRICTYHTFWALGIQSYTGAYAYLSGCKATQHMIENVAWLQDSGTSRSSKMFLYTNADNGITPKRSITSHRLTVLLTLKISSDQIWDAGYFGQPLTYPYFTIFSFNFCVTP
jgi:hypothetical protein